MPYWTVEATDRAREQAGKAFEQAMINEHFLDGALLVAEDVAYDGVRGVHIGDFPYLHTLYQTKFVWSEEASLVLRAYQQAKAMPISADAPWYEHDMYPPVPAPRSSHE